MKKQTGIWIDGSQAIIITLLNGNEQVNIIESQLENRIYHDKEGDKGSFMGAHHISHEKKFEERRKHQLKSYLEEITSFVADSNELYVFGPAETKIELEKSISDNKTLAKTLKKVESADHMTQNQIVAKVKDFYL